MPFPPSKRKRKRSRIVVASLMLTSLIDMFTIILLFLLQSYSMQGDVYNIDPKLKLPVSMAREAPNMRLIVQVTTDDLIVDGKKVASLAGLAEGKDLVIGPVLEALNRNTGKVEFIERSNPSFKFRGEVMVQADRRTPFKVLEKIMYTCGQAGYGNISLAVFTGE